jgi:hypothetical protein
LDPSRVTVHLAGPNLRSREWWRNWIEYTRDEEGNLIPASDKLTIAYCSKCNIAQLEKAEWAPEPETRQTGIGWNEIQEQAFWRASVHDQWDMLHNHKLAELKAVIPTIKESLGDQRLRQTNMGMKAHDWTKAQFERLKLS